MPKGKMGYMGKTKKPPMTLKTKPVMASKTIMSTNATGGKMMGMSKMGMRKK